MSKPEGWKNKRPDDSARHAAASRGVRTGRTERFEKEGPHASTSGAKRIVQEFLDEHKIPYTKLRARFIHFPDIGRDSMVFVKIYGWQPNPAIATLKRIGTEKGFRVETDWVF